MGCGSSASTMVLPARGKGREDSSGTGKPGAFPRGDSAVSTHTHDSGLGLDAGAGTAPLPTSPKALPGKLSPLAVPGPALGPALGPARERQPSSDIMEQLLNQGIITATPKVCGKGEAYSLMMDSTGGPPQRPPARLQSLTTSKGEPITSKEDMEEQMKRVEERRTVKEAELRQRLRSARLRGPAKPKKEEDEEEDEGDSDPAPHDPQQLAGPPTPGLQEADSSFLQAPPPAQEEEF